MIYEYIRVSADKQTTENQRFESSNLPMRINSLSTRGLKKTSAVTKKIEERKLANKDEDISVSKV
jgi:hypothetical protein